MQNNYKTQRQAARMGILTEEMQRASQSEGVDPGIIMEGVANGSVAIPANRLHSKLVPRAIGRGLSTKINVNLGVSGSCPDWELEWKKVETALSMKADAIMDLSSGEDGTDFRRKVIAYSSAMIGTVPIYELATSCRQDWKRVTARDFLAAVETQARDGVDFFTIHAGLNRSSIECLNRNHRLTSIVSRGGSLTCAWMAANQAENPFYEYFDELLDICSVYDVTLSLGDACRPGSINDASDACQMQELITLGELTLRAWEKDVQVIIEGPGHMAINEIEANVIMQKRLCHGAPFYVLGPLVSDVAPGYDHITAAIGGAVAAASGADFLCYVTPAEHLRLPTLDDMVEGIVATRIAAHAGDIAKGVKGARQWDNEMSQARFNLDWEGMFRLALHPEKARRYRQESRAGAEDQCTMCGELCAVKTMQQCLKPAMG